MKQIFGLFVAAAMVSISPANAKVTRLSAAGRALLEDTSHFTLLHSVREIPGDVLVACAVFAKETNFPLADPGKPFQSTDAVTNPKLLWRRLIWAAKGPGCYVIYYEKGGYAPSEHILLVKLGTVPKADHVTWSTSGFGMTDLKDYAAFVSELKSGKLDDDPKYTGW